MSLLSAFWTGALNAVGSMSDTAIPSTSAVIALFTAFTISLMLLDAEPVH